MKRESYIKHKKAMNLKESFNRIQNYDFKKGLPSWKISNTDRKAMKKILKQVEKGEKKNVK